MKSIVLVLNSVQRVTSSKHYVFLFMYIPELDYLEQTRQIELLEVYETMQTKTDLNWVLVWVWPKGKQADSLNHLWQ